MTSPWPDDTPLLHDRPQRPTPNGRGALHSSDAAWIARQKAKENPKPPRTVDGPALRTSADLFNEADREHRAAQEALTEASERAIAASAAREQAKQQYLADSRAYAATRAREKNQPKDKSK